MQTLLMNYKLKINGSPLLCANKETSFRVDGKNTLLFRSVMTYETRLNMADGEESLCVCVCVYVCAP